MRKRIVLPPLLLLAGFLAWFVMTRREWGPDLLGDPLYQSGRPSLCKPPAVAGDSVPARAEDLGQRPRLGGFEHAWSSTFDARGFTGGLIHLCSEYGSLRVRGVEGTRARIVMTISDPFPGGERAIADTRVNTSVRADTGGLRVMIWQDTQGMSTFRSLLAKGSRPAAVNLVLELPRTGVYALNLIVNHQRVTVRNVDVRGLIEGYLSPGADLDVGLAGPLTLRLNGETLKADWRREAGVDFLGGTSATLRPVDNASVEAILNQGDLALTFVGDEVGLEVTASAAPAPPTIEIGAVEARHADSTGTFIRSAGYASAMRKVKVRAATSRGTVVVRRSGSQATQP